MDHYKPEEEEENVPKKWLGFCFINMKNPIPKHEIYVNNWNVTQLHYDKVVKWIYDGVAL